MSIPIDEHQLLLSKDFDVLESLEEGEGEEVEFDGKDGDPPNPYSPQFRPLHCRVFTTEEYPRKRLVCIGSTNDGINDDRHRGSGGEEPEN